jgi:hypothetical protein
MGYTSSAAVIGGTPPYDIYWNVYEYNSNALLNQFQGDTLACIPADQVYRIECIASDSRSCADTLSVITPQILALVKHDQLVQVHPQPFHHAFRISNRCMQGPVTLQIFDVWGRLCYSDSFLNLSAPQDVYPGELPAGIYFLSLNSDSFVFRKTLIRK